MNADGIILVDKPKGITSAKVVELIKKRFKIKAGHTGTLDPLATGLLIILLGKKTKEAQNFLKLDKTYEVGGILGIETDTYDITGKILKKNDKRVKKEELIQVLKKIKGEILQTPPPFSAKKIKGKEAYKLARQGKKVKIKAGKVTVYSLDLTDFSFPYFRILCHVSSGFYIRSLIHDMGKKLGTGASVYSLRRLKIGKYDIKNAKPLKEIINSNSKNKK